MKHRIEVMIVLTVLTAAIAHAEWTETKPKPGDSKELNTARLRLKNMERFSKDHPAVREQLKKITALERTNKK